MTINLSSIRDNKNRGTVGQFLVDNISQPTLLNKQRISLNNFELYRNRIYGIVDGVEEN